MLLLAWNLKMHKTNKNYVNTKRKQKRTTLETFRL